MFLDLADALCEDTRCPSEIGNVLIYLDDNHLTASYAATVAGFVEERTLDVLGG